MRGYVEVGVVGESVGADMVGGVGVRLGEVGSKVWGGAPSPRSPPDWSRRARRERCSHQSIWPNPDGLRHGAYEGTSDAKGKHEVTALCVIMMTRETIMMTREDHGVITFETELTKNEGTGGPMTVSPVGSMMSQQVITMSDPS